MGKMLSHLNIQDKGADVKKHSEELVTKIRNSVIGDGKPIQGPFGLRPLIYADFVASGRALNFVETAMRNIVLPVYGNTHTETSYTGREITALREEARATIAAAVGASEDHAVIFSGGGATSAVDRLIGAMGICDNVSAGQRVVVFVGPYEHHSNDLPWRETGANIERIALGADGNIDLDHLEERLKDYPEETFKIGAFSAASNVTGIRSKLYEIAKLLHQYNSIFVCDFAAAAPYIDMQLRITTQKGVEHIDAIIYSPHKFIGGPGASGVLIADKKLFTGAKPAVSGGGTVSYVTSNHHRYVTDLVRREEAGTPNIVGDIRAGAVMALKQAIGSQEIEHREQLITQKALKRLSDAPNIDILGPLDQPRIGVISFNIRAGDRRLHYGFVVALLNDLFGVQSRGGCSCAGPYAHELLEISADDASEFERAVSSDLSILRPGWVRIGFNYFFDGATADYITDAILFIANYGTRFLDDYEVNLHEGLWKHKANSTHSNMQSSTHHNAKAHATMTKYWEQDRLSLSTPTGTNDKIKDETDYIMMAKQLAADRPCPILHQVPVFKAHQEVLREFWLPQDILKDENEPTELTGHKDHA